jgi:type IV secretory pathway TrbL component
MAQTPAGRRWPSRLHSSRHLYAAAALLSLLLLAPGHCSSLLDGEPAAAGAGRTSSSSSTQEAGAIGDMDAAVAIAAGEAAGASADTANSCQSEPGSSNPVGGGMLPMNAVLRKLGA